jgi:hypothetical protein
MGSRVVVAGKERQGQKQILFDDDNKKGND